MAAGEPGTEPQGSEAIEAYEAALADFAEKLNLLHIAGGTPSYATIASASVRPRLTTTGLNEMLSGKRLPSLESLLEFVRVVTTPSGLDKPAAQKFRADATLVETWRGHWQDTNLLQRRAQPANRRLKATVRQIHDDAVREAEAVRTAAHAEAERIRTSAQTDAEDIRAQARRDAADVLGRAREAATAPTPDGPGPQRTAREVSRSGRPLIRGRGAALRTRLRPAAAVLVVAALAVATVLVGDSLRGEPGACRDGGPQAGQIASDPGSPRRPIDIRPAAFVAEPAVWLTFPPGRVPFSIPSDTSSPTPTSSPPPEASPTPSPPATPSPTPSPSKSGRCADSST
ncbi:MULTISPECIES: hypothetical protein [unclassified Streptomyces]|uniref:hypothetical protein n=1 Tax=unclassified Streptomyces TaxID=2593676 RepID=UPI0004CA5E38|nr:MULTISPECIES: hypothetical protein [unclassified Streptomyces]KJY16469.1 hypothetical protein VR43_34160 [Streptomyces sp. NRRL S-104]